MIQRFKFDELQFARQYVLSNVQINCPFNHHSVSLPDKYRLDYHTNLAYTEVLSNEKRIILLGEVYSSEKPELGNKDILQNCLSLEFSDLIMSFTRLAGRYVVIFCDREGIRIFHDVSTSRKVYYMIKGGSFICSSNPHLLARLFELKPTEDPSKLKYYHSRQFVENSYSNIGNHTYYDEIRQLLPNHYMNFSSLEILRFWPKDIDPRSDQECVEESAKMIKGFIQAASLRYPLMVPITAGIDSRVILAATREISDKVFYYLNDSEKLKESADYYVPSKMLPTLGLELHILNSNVQAEAWFKDIFMQNNPLGNVDFINVIFNYWKKFPGYLNLPGNTLPVVKYHYQSHKQKADALTLASLKHYEQYEFVVSYYNEWLEDLGDYLDHVNFNIYDLYFLEDHNCNRVSQMQMDKDISQEEFVPFSSAYLISLMLLYDRGKRKTPYHQLHKDMIKLLWPELLKFPINPSRRNTIFNILAKVRLYEPARRIKKMLS